MALRHAGHEKVKDFVDDSIGRGAVGGAAQKRADGITRAVAGAETVPAVTDSSGNAIASASPLSPEERATGKKAIS